jgi:hypothetical protein
MAFEKLQYSGQAIIPSGEQGVSLEMDVTFLLE